ncbi:inosine triphosphate pyrophosphatase-like protein [Glomus cerebriforme]|uniref:Inosine triphosphate pyrophosphatase-like protein n=1 Tax=Glomus cerebriforme TaxID=658196 RepID=A0A397TEE1_9GLOM|nr:inosine triphosphate pyrophosphatase-like protein [Glomus cerebriforme]
MPFAFVRHLKNKRVVLASGSPRRREILTRLGLNFDVVPSKFPETLDKAKYAPSEYAITNATEKGLEVYGRLVQDDQEVDIVIAADTIVSIDGDILEKPKDTEDALRILKRLNGRSHRVYTGIAFIYSLKESVHPNYKIVSFTEETEVIFRKCSEEDFNAYIETGEPMDKAGAYGYQALGSFFVEKINGCYYNVVGFPTKVFIELEKLVKKQEI